MTTQTQIQLDTTPQPKVDDQGTQGGEKLYAGKYKSVEELERGYAEAQKLIGSNATAPAATAPQTPAAASADRTIADAQSAVESAGLNWDELNTEFAEKGVLSDATFDKLAKSGIPRNVAEAYIEGQRALASKYDGEITSAVGGEDKYNAMLTWAKGLPTAEKQAFNDAVMSRDVNRAKLAVNGMWARYVKANGNPPTLVNGTVNGSGSAVQPFKSQAEVTKAMADNRYRSDPAYRQEVVERLRVSQVFA